MYINYVLTHVMISHLLLIIVILYYIISYLLFQKIYCHFPALFMLHKKVAFQELPTLIRSYVASKRGLTKGS